MFGYTLVVEATIEFYRFGTKKALVAFIANREIRNGLVVHGANVAEFAGKTITKLSANTDGKIDLNGTGNAYLQWNVESNRYALLVDDDVVFWCS